MHTSSSSRTRTRRSHTHRPPDFHSPKALTKTTASTPPTESAIAKRVKSIEEARREVASSPFFKALLHQLTTATLPPTTPPTQEEDTDQVRPLLPRIKSFVIYGLGSLDESTRTTTHIRYQLALALELYGLVQSSIEQIPQIYDPVFTPLDIAVLHALGLQVLEVNEEGRRVASHPTLFYLPHCEAGIMDNNLATNLEAGTLHNVVMLGNSFSSYQERWSWREGLCRATATAAFKPETMLELVDSGRVMEMRVSEEKFPVAAAFNDMSLHTFLF